MRRLLPRFAAASTTLLAVLMPAAGANFGLGAVETVYLAPTSYSYSPVVATSYSYSPVVTTSYSYSPVVSTSYVTTSDVLVPTAYSTGYSYVPTAYSTTAYVPSYSAVPTAAVVYPGLYRRGLFGGLRPIRRPVYETAATYSYEAMPTTVAYPTTTSLRLPYVATAATVATGFCNESPVAFNPPTGPSDGASPTGKTVVSSPNTTKGTDPSYSGPRPETNKAAGAVGEMKKADEAKPAESNEGIASPPDGPAPDVRDLPPPEDPKENRKAFRPKFTEVKAREVASTANVLRGEVVSQATSKGLSNVQVVFSDVKGIFGDRKKTTDNTGAFQVYLPTGDWSISIVDTAAIGGPKVLNAGQVTSANGQYLEEDGKPIFGLRIHQ